jgi:hypothetical protein
MEMYGRESVRKVRRGEVQKLMKNASNGMCLSIGTLEVMEHIQPCHPSLIGFQCYVAKFRSHNSTRFYCRKELQQLT